MIRIDTIEDLVRVLDRHPDWREAVRLRLLSRELLELPSRFSDFREEMKNFVAETTAPREETAAFVAEMKAFQAEMHAFVAEMKAFQAEMYAFVAEMKAFQAEMKAFQAEMYAFVAEMKAFQAEMYAFREATERNFQSLRDDLGVLKGAHARNAAERSVGLIALSMGLRRRRVLDGEKLFELARDAGADMRGAGIASYLEADLVFEAEDDQGATVYVALEVSYTANGRDTTRALRNAEMIGRFTGAACRAAVASLQVDDRIAKLVESGEVAWYRLPRRVLEAA